jgi:hypothetical protein
MVEAMARGCPVVSSNDAFRAIAKAEGFSDCAIEHAEEALLLELSRQAKMGIEERNMLSVRQAEVAHRDHTLDGLISRLNDVLIAGKSQ